MYINLGDQRSFISSSFFLSFFLPGFSGSSGVAAAALSGAGAAGFGVSGGFALPFGFDADGFGAFSQCPEWLQSMIWLC